MPRAGVPASSASIGYTEERPEGIRRFTSPPISRAVLAEGSSLDHLLAGGAEKYFHLVEPTPRFCQQARSEIVRPPGPDSFRPAPSASSDPSGGSSSLTFCHGLLNDQTF